MLFKFAESAARRWRFFNGVQWLIEVAKDTRFHEGQILTQVAAGFMTAFTTFDMTSHPVSELQSLDDHIASVGRRFV